MKLPVFWAILLPEMVSYGRQLMCLHYKHGQRENVHLRFFVFETLSQIFFSGHLTSRSGRVWKITLLCFMIGQMYTLDFSFLKLCKRDLWKHTESFSKNVKL